FFTDAEFTRPVTQLFFAQVDAVAILWFPLALIVCHSFLLRVLGYPFRQVSDFARLGRGWIRYPQAAALTHLLRRKDDGDMTKPRNTICLWSDKDAEEAARFYAATFPDSKVIAVHKAPSDYPGGKAGQVITVEFTVLGIPCLGLNGGPTFRHNESFSFQVATDNQEETDRYWNAIVGNGGRERN